MGSARRIPSYVIIKFEHSTPAMVYAKGFGAGWMSFISLLL